jgi:hypothetical protein
VHFRKLKGSLSLYLPSLSTVKMGKPDKELHTGISVGQRQSRHEEACGDRRIDALARQAVTDRPNLRPRSDKLPARLPQTRTVNREYSKTETDDPADSRSRELLDLCERSRNDSSARSG